MGEQSKIGVGFIGAGVVVQSIHLPVLAALAGQFDVVALWDIDRDLAFAVAEGCGACASGELSDLLADPKIEVVAVCSPAAFHAEHVIAAIEAGKRAVLVEKPLAASREEAARIARAAAVAGTTVVVGAMHVYDPGWRAFAVEAKVIAAEASLIRSSIVLPFNARFEPWAFEPLERVADFAPAAAPDSSLTLQRRLAILNGGITQLAIHDLPLVRTLLRDPSVIEVTSVQTFAPFGYAITARAGTQLLDLFAHVADHWQPCWTVEAHGRDASLQVEFSPSFVAAGSAVGSVTRNGSTTRYPRLHGNGYDGEWRALAAQMRGGEAIDIPPVDALALDLNFAFDILEQARALASPEGSAA